MKKNHLRSMIAAAFAATLSLGFVGVASASDGYQETVKGTPDTSAGPGSWCDIDNRMILGTAPTTSHLWGRGCFIPYGDKFWIEDEDGDGYSVGIQWRLLEGGKVVRQGLIRDKLGDGVSTMLDKDFPEHDTIKYRMGRCNVTSFIDCHSFTDYIGYSPTDNNGNRWWICADTTDANSGAFCDKY